MPGLMFRSFAIEQRVKTKYGFALHQKYGLQPLHYGGTK